LVGEEVRQYAWGNELPRMAQPLVNSEAVKAQLVVGAYEVKKTWKAFLAVLLHLK
jgi:hypothetical protein